VSHAASLLPAKPETPLAAKVRKNAAMVVAATAARMPAVARTCLNATSCKVNNTATSEKGHTPTKDGACKCLYSSDADDNITEISSGRPSQISEDQMPKDLSTLELPARGNCWLVINAFDNQTAYNIRIVELVVCELMSSWRPAACEPACIVQVNIPKPSNPDDLNSTTACIALAIYSRLQDNPVFQRVAVIGGLADSTGNISSIGARPAALSKKLEAAHNKWYHRALIPAADKDMYRETDYFDKYKGEDRVSHYPDVIVNPVKTMWEINSYAVSVTRVY
jgi:hypothetical protein